MFPRCAAVLVLAGVSLGCAAPTLRALRDEPPFLTLPANGVALDVLDCPERAQLEQALVEGLPDTGRYEVITCPQGAQCQAPAWLRAVVVERTISPRVDIPNKLTAQAILDSATEVTVVTRVDITGFDGYGQQLFARTYTGTKHGNSLKTDKDTLILQSLRYAVGALVRELKPRQLRLELRLETGGVLDEGVERALGGDLAGAKASLEAVTAQQPTLASAWYDLGVVHEVSGDDVKAMDCYRRAVALHDKWLYLEAVKQLESRLGVARK
ncbi:MAG: hypothetical protein AB1938_27575 [Myxococcota bacterium]